MRCAECGAIVKIYHNTIFPNQSVYCDDCKREFLDSTYQIDFRLQDIEGSLQYDRTARRKSLEEIEGEK